MTDEPDEQKSLDNLESIHKVIIGKLFLFLLAG